MALNFLEGDELKGDWNAPTRGTEILLRVGGFESCGTWHVALCRVAGRLAADFAKDHFAVIAMKSELIYAWSLRQNYVSKRRKHEATCQKTEQHSYETFRSREIVSFVVLCVTHVEITAAVTAL